MSMKELDEALGMIEVSSNADFDGPKSEELITIAERFLNIKFPPTYKKFLMLKGCGDINGKEFYGIINDKFENSSIPNGIWLTADLREKFGVPKTLLFIAESGEGYYAIDLSQKTEGNEAAIIDWNNGKKNGPYDLIYADFGEFLLARIKA